MVYLHTYCNDDNTLILTYYYNNKNCYYIFLLKYMKIHGNEWDIIKLKHKSLMYIACWKKATCILEDKRIKKANTRRGGNIFWVVKLRIFNTNCYDFCIQRVLYLKSIFLSNSLIELDKRNNTPLTCLSSERHIDVFVVYLFHVVGQQKMKVQSLTAWRRFMYSLRAKWLRKFKK